MAHPAFEGFEERRARVQILILGSYRAQINGSRCEERLNDLREFLTSVGYMHARLVSDFPDVPSYKALGPAHFEVKSKEKIIGWATGLIFVFMLGCNQEGVGEELTFVDTKNPNLFHSSTVLIERGVDLSKLTGGPLTRHEIEGNEFETEVNLSELAVAACTKIVLRNYWKI